VSGAEARGASPARGPQGRLRAVNGSLVVSWRRIVESRWARWVAELGVLLAVAIGAAFAVHALVAVHFDFTNPTARSLGPIWAAAMISLAVAAHLAQRRRLSPARLRLIVSALAGIAVGTALTPLMAGLHGTDQPPNTIIGGDIAFHTEYVTRFAATWHLQDYTFRGLHSFYPPAWFWLAGRTADVLGVTPWQIVKPFTIGTVGAALLLAYVLWRMTLSPAGALSAAIGSSLVLAAQVGPVEFATQAWYSPHSCFVAVVGPAWLAATLPAVRHGGARAHLVLLGLAGLLLALCYYLLFLLLLAVLIVLALAPRAGRRAVSVRLATLCGGIALVTAVFWIPLLGAALQGSAAQGHFVRPDFLRVFTGLGGPTALSLLAVLAIALISLTWSFTGSQALGGLLVGAVLYQLASMTALAVAHTQFQPHRAVTMMWATFGAAVPVALEGLERPDSILAAVGAPVARAFKLATVSLGVLAVFLLGAAQGADLAAGPYTRAAHKQRPIARAAAVSNFITQTARKPSKELTVLTSDRSLMVTEPYYGFVALEARYAHPEADLPERIAVLRAAAGCPDAACTTRRLETSRFGPIDALMLARLPEGYRIQTEVDAFPRPRHVTVIFPRGSFASAVWAKRDFGPYSVFVRRPGA
jgi:galactan 5-O-arabinofuranosyltransferase